MHSEQDCQLGNLLLPQTASLTSARTIILDCKECRIKEESGREGKIIRIDEIGISGQVKPQEKRNNAFKEITGTMRSD